MSKGKKIGAGAAYGVRWCPAACERARIRELGRMPFSTARHAAGDTSSLVANQESVLPFFTGMDAKRPSG